MDTHAAESAAPRGAARAKPPLVRLAIWAFLIFFARRFNNWVVARVEARYLREHPPLPTRAPHDLLRITPAVYEGPPIVLRSGTPSELRLTPGRAIVEFHINGREASGNILNAAAWEDLSSIAAFLASSAGEKYAALRGRSTLRHYMQWVEAEIRELPPSLRTWGEQTFCEMLIIKYYRHPWRRLTHGYGRIADAWFTRGDLFLLVARHTERQSAHVQKERASPS